jgi:hypothetical protein
MEEVTGNPDPKHISTSFVERQNLTMRTSMRGSPASRMRSLKKLENHAAMVRLYFMCYNVARMSQTLRVTPAMEAGISDHVGSIEDVVGRLEGNDSRCDARPSSLPFWLWPDAETA